MTGKNYIIKYGVEDREVFLLLLDPKTEKRQICSYSKNKPQGLKYGSKVVYGDCNI